MERTKEDKRGNFNSKLLPFMVQTYRWYFPVFYIWIRLNIKTTSNALIKRNTSNTNRWSNCSNWVTENGITSSVCKYYFEFENIHIFYFAGRNLNFDLNFLLFFTSCVPIFAASYFAHNIHHLSFRLFPRCFQWRKIVVYSTIAKQYTHTKYKMSAQFA